MKIQPVGTKLFHVDRHDEANSHIRNFVNVPKN
jgi:hypothetical protein